MVRTVSLADLAERVGGSLDEAVRTVERANGRAKHLRLTVPEDIAEQLAATCEQVREIVRDEELSLAAAKSAYNRYSDDHARARYQAGAAAYNAALEGVRQREIAGLRADGYALPTGYSGSPEARSAVREAPEKALEQWDRRRPLLDFPTFHRKGANLR